MQRICKLSSGSSSMEKRKRHTASFLLSHFLNSKESLAFEWLTGNLLSILRYMYDVMEINYNKTNLLICDLSIEQIATYSRTGRETVKRGLVLCVEHELLKKEFTKPRSPNEYGMGNLIATRLTMSLDDHELDNKKAPTRLTTSLALGSPRAQCLYNKKRDKKERAQKARFPLSNNFIILEATKQKARDIGLSEVEMILEIEKFTNHYQGTGDLRADWNATLRNWFIRASEYQKARNKARGEPSQKARNEPSAIVPPKLGFWSMQKQEEEEKKAREKTQSSPVDRLDLPTPTHDVNGNPVLSPSEDFARRRKLYQSRQGALGDEQSRSGTTSKASNQN